MKARQLPTNYLRLSFGKGCGADRFEPGFYGLGENVNCEYGEAQPGPREVVDVTGIAAGYRVKAMCWHAGGLFIATDNGTDTKIYRQETTWVLAATISAATVAGPYALVSFNSVLAVALGTGDAYQFSTNTGAVGAGYTFTASTKSTASSKYANCFLVQSNGLVTPRVVYATSPNELYFTTDLTNGDATGSTATYITDANSTDNYVTSLREEDTGQLLIGMRRALWSLDGDLVRPQRLTHDFPDPPGDAGGQSDRNNFEASCEVNGRVYYIVSGSELIEYDHGRINEFMAPKWQGPRIPRMGLPLNAICAVGGKVYLAMGTGNTLLGVAHAAGGTARTVANIPGTTSDLYVGQYVEDPDDGSRRFTWHGVILKCTSLLRFMWFDEDTDYLYLCSGASEAINLQQYRCIVTKDNGLYHLKSSVIVLNTGTWKLEVLGIDYGLPYYAKKAMHIACRTIGLASTTPSLEVEYKVTGDYDATAFKSDFVTFIVNNRAELGENFPANTIFHTMDLRFVGIGGTNVYAVLQEAELLAEDSEIQATARVMR